MLLGDAPVTTARLTSKVTEGFPFYSPEVDQTAFLARGLESLGKSLDYSVMTGQGSHGSKPSLDICWRQPGRGIALAAQCCWGTAGEVAEVFTNLMSVKAPLKLLIFRTRPSGAERQDVLVRSDIDAVLKALGVTMLDYAQHLEGEIYVLLERVDQQFRSYEFRVPASGKLTLGFEQAARMFCVQECVAAAAS